MESSMSVPSFACSEATKPIARGLPNLFLSTGFNFPDGSRNVEAPSNPCWVLRRLF